MDHQQQLLDIYRENPCRTLPNAFWKTSIVMDKSRLSVRRNSTGELTALALWQESRLMSFWCAEPEVHPLSPRQIAQAKFALVHAGSLPIFEQRQFTQRKAYFRIVHEGTVPADGCPPGFVYKNVRPHAEVDAVAATLNACYPNINMSREIVCGWLDHPVYDPDLWVWILNAQTGEKAALGIAELDSSVPEASLEWIQVHPIYQKKGLGKAVVTELLRRLSGKADFTTVSGEVDNVHNPENIYRQCGFTGTDVWWLLAS